MKAVTKETIKIYWQHSMKYKPAFFSLAFFTLFGIACNLYRPFIYKKIFNLLALGHITSAQYGQLLWQLGILMILIWLAWRVQALITNFYEAKVISDLLNTCFNYLHDHSFSFFSDNFGGSLVRKVTRYARSFEDIADQVFSNMGSALVYTFTIVVVLFFERALFGLVALAWVFLYLAITYLFARYRFKFGLARAEMDSVVTGHLADTVNNSTNLKLFSAKLFEFAAFKRLTDQLYDLRKRSWDLAAFNDAVQSVLMFSFELIIMYTAFKYWQRGDLTIGDFALLQAYMLQLFDRLWDVGGYVRRLYDSFADANEMTEILMLPHEVQDAAGAQNLAVSKGKIDLVSVNFEYNKGNPVFADFSLSIKSGEKLAIIGPSGGGKTTFVKLLLRFMDIQSGQILIDGQNIASVTQNSLRHAIAMVPQEPILFHRSLMENIRYGRPEATDEEVIAAAKLAHCHEFIAAFPQGYQTYVGERGVKLSGGERQRVAIARAILKDAPILILDEATSSLDSESEHLIQDALKNLMAHKTAVVIAHRLSTIMQMDRIVVIDKGRIVEEGTHHDLLKVKKGTYQKLWQIQAGGFKAGAAA